MRYAAKQFYTVPDPNPPKSAVGTSYASTLGPICYAGATLLLRCYAVASTDTGYTGTTMSLWCYAVAGTEKGMR
eukprot:294610-Rhodomonas_salina.2